MRALIVDDERTNVLLLSNLITKMGFAVETAEDGAQAWEAYQAAPFPLVVTDWLMPHTSGVELCQRIREAEGVRVQADGTLARGKTYTFVLMVTSLSEEEHTIEAFKRGVDDMLVKPVDATQLSARLRAGERMVRDHAASTEATLRAAVGSLQQHVGPDSPALLGALGDLVAIYRQQDAHTKARAFLRRQIDITRATHGPTHVITKKLQRDLENLGGSMQPLPPGPVP